MAVNTLAVVYSTASVVDVPYKVDDTGMSDQITDEGRTYVDGI